MKTVKYIKVKFEKDGFIVLRNLLTKKEISNFEKKLFTVYSKKLQKKLNHKNIHEIIFETEKKKYFDLLYSCYKNFIKTSPYRKVQKKLSFFSRKIFKKKFKYLNSGMAIGIRNSKRTAYNWHQEQSYYTVKNTIHFQFPIIIPAKKINGTMSVLSGSQKIGQIKEVTNIKLSKKSINTYLPKNISRLKKNFTEKFINMKLGDVCMFSDNIVHRTNKNYSNKIRFVPIVRLQST